MVQLWFSLYKPQESEYSNERLSPEDRQSILTELDSVAVSFRKSTRQTRSLMVSFGHPGPG
jgi:hypothetical protein